MEELRLAFNTGATMLYRLFKVDFEFHPDNTVANFTEADFSGYAAITVNTWGAAATFADGRAHIAVTPDISWGHDGGPTANTVYGYYVTRGGILMWAEKFQAGGFLLDGLGDGITLPPRFTGKSEFPEL